MRNSLFVKNSGNAVFSISGGIDVDGSQISGSTNGVNCQSGTIRLSNTTLFRNTVGVLNSGGTILTFGNNHNSGTSMGTITAVPAGSNF